MALHRNNQLPFERRIRLVMAAGVTMPGEIDEIKQRLADVRQILDGAPMQDRLIGAVIAGDKTADLDLLTAGARAEALGGAPLRADLFNAVRTEVNRKIREVYDSVAVSNYEQLAHRFDEAAQAFTTAAAVVDPELPADAVVDASEKIRKAWRGAELCSQDMNRLLPALQAAASLAGICSDDPDDALPLCVDTAGMFRRRVWDAWLTDDRQAKAVRVAAIPAGPFTVEAVPITRTGRWGALLRLGAIVRAHPPTQPFEPYRRPKHSDPADDLLTTTA